MTLAVAFRAAARREVVEAAAWYEAQRPGLGAEFLDEVERCVASAADRPELYAMVRGEIRRAVTRRFPYSIHYRVRHERIVVLAVSWQASPADLASATLNSMRRVRCIRN